MMIRELGRDVSLLAVQHMMTALRDYGVMCIDLLLLLSETLFEF